MKIGHVIVPADDLGAQLAFYEGLGLTTRFRDGDRYAAVTDGAVTLGLADESQQPVAGRVLVSVEVDDLDAVLEGYPGTEVVVGPHERRATITDPSGNPVVVYEKLA
ncbi:VOC family protein [Nocardioides marmoriginsengisoli]|uniref:VOC family protein n=1 Tax=Nocardioides marmoriginsengisoli TaxID=661483 RepID=A0A3N0CEV9_9ACTN|nr:VOC family protein [Nocardioides marmoriginsengisoli]RNL61968.1 VOC family protein [Nocardioides marmoriginsengisoli]